MSCIQEHDPALLYALSLHDALPILIVVTSNYHIPRSLMEIRRVAEQSRVIPYPVVNTEFGRFGWMARPDIARVLFIEYVDRKSTRLNSSHVKTSYAVFCLKKKKHVP